MPVDLQRKVEICKNHQGALRKARKDPTMLYGGLLFNFFFFRDTNGLNHASCRDGARHGEKMVQDSVWFLLPTSHATNEWIIYIMKTNSPI